MGSSQLLARGGGLPAGMQHVMLSQLALPQSTRETHCCPPAFLQGALGGGGAGVPKQVVSVIASCMAQ